MSTIFSKIVNGEIPCHKIAETEEFLAFLDVSPCAKGHTLVIPKAEVDYIFDLDDELYLRLMAFSKKVASYVKQAIPCKRIGISVIGLEVPHAHVHLIPLKSMADMDFGKKLTLSQEDLTEIAVRIRSVI
ncbi:MAG: histidine triad (HIT) family protein [Arcticibacterium sp.]|jgi:histidine triad (HIT) family protein